MKDTKQIAEEHAEWFSQTMKEIVKITYKTAFIHGVKHGEEKAQ